MDEYTMTWSDAVRAEASASALADGTWAPAPTGAASARPAEAAADRATAPWLGLLARRLPRPNEDRA
ncbi:hypothetical protein [Piscinibacter koreensis]|uniref:Uncharacterized protein n=1 Tax=Piscinibacter koreensis TaxID=2742824 RepID=A0A7Y6NNS0_9BURK|nr:hypothetical protein [Schlegelella koreensis]NUZ06491.1 hypothetical protein [Schlegelella koreensis]